MERELPVLIEKQADKLLAMQGPHVNPPAQRE